MQHCNYFSNATYTGATPQITQKSE